MQSLWYFKPLRTPIISTEDERKKIKHIPFSLPAQTLTEFGELNIHWIPYNGSILLFVPCIDEHLPIPHPQVYFSFLSFSEYSDCGSYVSSIKAVVKMSHNTIKHLGGCCNMATVKHLECLPNNPSRAAGSVPPGSFCSPFHFIKGLSVGTLPLYFSPDLCQSVLF